MTLSYVNINSSQQCHMINGVSGCRITHQDTIKHV